jgi:hypothetical protein
VKNNIPEIGDEFELVTVIAEAPNNRFGQRRWLCKCKCGTEKTILSYRLAQGLTRSCGCLQRKTASQMAKTHGKSGTTEYRIWIQMIQRCENPKHPHYDKYGGRGVKVCERWRTSFENFFEDMGTRPDGLTIDRYPNKEGDYEASNCRWATQPEQVDNRSNTKLITHNGETLSLKEWAKKIGMSREALYARLYVNKWTVEEALTAPANQKRKTRTEGEVLTRTSKVVQTLTAFGRTQTIGEWAKETGLPPTTINMRMRCGTWTPEDIVTVPKGARKGTGRPTGVKNKAGRLAQPFETPNEPLTHSPEGSAL